MTHDKQLIERLNNAADKLDAVFDKDFAAQICIREAAQRISTLTAEIEELRERALRLLLCVELGDPYDNIKTHARNLRATLTKGEGTER